MIQQSMTSRTQSFGLQNPIANAVSAIRSAQDDLTPNQRAVRDLGRQRTSEAIGSGAFSLTPRR